MKHLLSRKRVAILIGLVLVMVVAFHLWFRYGGPYAAAEQAWRAQSPGNAGVGLCFFCSKRVSGGDGRMTYRFTIHVAQGSATRDVRVKAVNAPESGRYDVTFDSE